MRRLANSILISSGAAVLLLTGCLDEKRAHVADGVTVDPGAQLDPGGQPDPGTLVDPDTEPDPGKQPDPDVPPDPWFPVDPGSLPDPGPPDPGLPPDPGQPDPGAPPDPGQPDPGAPPDPGWQPDPGPKVDVPVSAGACMNPSDLAVEREVAEDASKNCTLACLASVDAATCAVECMLDTNGDWALALSEDCAACFAGQILCLVDHCMTGGECFDPDSLSCQQCAAANCVPAYFACTGFEADCTDGVDDNGDGNTDCDDPSCAGQQGCF